DDIEARIKAARDNAVRALRDRRDLFEDGGNVIKLGPRHRFSVNTQALDLTLLPRRDQLALHLTGTDYMEPIDDPALDALKPFWPVSLESESPALYRGEYLAGQMLAAALAGGEGPSLPALQQLALDPDALAGAVREHAAARYRDGYEKGIHDHDAALILRRLFPLHRDAGRRVHPPSARALAFAFWAGVGNRAGAWLSRIEAARAIDAIGNTRAAIDELRAALAAEIAAMAAEPAAAIDDADPDAAAAYIVECANGAETAFQVSAGADALVRALRDTLSGDASGKAFGGALAHLKDHRQAARALFGQALAALTVRPALAGHAHYLPEAVALYLRGATVRHEVRQATLSATVEGLLGEHPRIESGRMALAIDDALARYRTHMSEFVPGYRRYQALRADIIQRQREAMRLSEFKPRPLASFVRNRLINEVYLPVIGDNLAKQMGTAGEEKRSDLMGLLMMISPPGYGKTTLMEYVAHRLGLVFMKINGPALGHEVRSLDPAQAPDATSRQELEKLNLALEMGNNVMLYVDDIQHTHPEFLQKFISLCDGTRR